MFGLCSTTIFANLGNSLFLFLQWQMEIFDLIVKTKCICILHHNIIIIIEKKNNFWNFENSRLYQLKWSLSRNKYNDNGIQIQNINWSYSFKLNICVFFIVNWGDRVGSVIVVYQFINLQIVCFFKSVIVWTLNPKP